MNTPKISAIVPVYNAERYLPMLVDSILAQTFRDFELLLVDDGSTDSSPAICDAYAEKDERVRVIHKANGGVSSARNRGIEEARGEFVFFADNDDYVFPDCFATAVETIGERDFLIFEACCTQRSEFNPNPQNRSTDTTDRIEANSLDEIKAKIGDMAEATVIWICLYKRNILVENNIFFENVKSEDILFNRKYFNHINSFVQISHYQGYYWVLNSHSQSTETSYFVDKDWVARMDEEIHISDKRLESEDHSWRKHRINYLIACYFMRYLLKGYYSELPLPRKERKARWAWLRQNRLFQEVNREFAGKTRSMKVLFWLCQHGLFGAADALLKIAIRH